MRNQGAQGPQLNRFHPTTVAAMMVKMERTTQAITEAYITEMTALKAEVITLKSQVAAFESVVDAVTPTPIPAPPPAIRRPAPPAAAAAKPVPPPPPPPPPAVPIAPSWATVTRKARRGKAVQTQASVVESFHMNRPPTESYAQFMARRNSGYPAPIITSTPSPKRQQTNTTPPLRPRRLLVKRNG